MSDKQNPDNALNTEIGKHHLRVRLRTRVSLRASTPLSGELWNNDAGFHINHSRKRHLHHPAGRVHRYRNHPRRLRARDTTDVTPRAHVIGAG